MCCDDKCCFFIRVELGSLIFGYISAILSGIGTIICTVITLIFSIQLLIRNSYVNEINNIEIIILVSMFLIEFVFGFTASVFLLLGINQKKSSYVKGYVIYGIIQVVLMVIAFIILDCLTYMPVPLGFVQLVFVVMYISILYMIYQTFKKLQPVHSLQNDVLEV